MRDEIAILRALYSIINTSRTQYITFTSRTVAKHAIALKYNVSPRAVNKVVEKSVVRSMVLKTSFVLRKLVKCKLLHIEDVHYRTKRYITRLLRYRVTDELIHLAKTRSEEEFISTVLCMLGRSKRSR